MAEEQEDHSTDFFSFDLEKYDPTMTQYPDIVNTTANLVVKPEDRKSRNVMSRYEARRLTSLRAQQLQQSAPSTLNEEEKKKIPKNNYYYANIARLELKNKVIPMYIRRKMPDNSLEIWFVKELAQIVD